MMSHGWRQKELRLHLLLLIIVVQTVTGNVLFAVLSSSSCAENLPCVNNLEFGGSAGFDVSKQDVKHNAFKQVVVEAGVVTMTIEWKFNPTLKTIRERFDNAVAVEEAVEWRVHGSYGSDDLKGTWQFSDSAHPNWVQPNWGQRSFSNDDGTWGAANTNMLNGNTKCLSSSPNPKYGMENCNSADAYGGSCNKLYIGATSKTIGSETKVMMYATTTGGNNTQNTHNTVTLTPTPTLTQRSISTYVHQQSVHIRPSAVLRITSYP